MQCISYDNFKLLYIIKIVFGKKKSFNKEVVSNISNMPRIWFKKYWILDIVYIWYTNSLNSIRKHEMSIINLRLLELKRLHVSPGCLIFSIAPLCMPCNHLPIDRNSDKLCHMTTKYRIFCWIIQDRNNNLVMPVQDLLSIIWLLSTFS